VVPLVVRVPTVLLPEQQLGSEQEAKEHETTKASGTP
jgi:hypothetical protein